MAAELTDKPTVGIRKDAVEPAWRDLWRVGARLLCRRTTTDTKREQC